MVCQYAAEAHRAPGEDGRSAITTRMYFPDLTPYGYYVEKGDRPALNVGWLDPAYEFTTGAPPPGFLDRLHLLSRAPVKQMLGYKACPLCPELLARFKARPWSEEDKAFISSCWDDGHFSSSEIRVRGADGRTYAAPFLITHYVQAHGYLPPEEFVEAVMQTNIALHIWKWKVSQNWNQLISTVKWRLANLWEE